MVFAVRPEKGTKWVCKSDRELEESKQTWFYLDTPDHATCVDLMDMIRAHGFSAMYPVGTRIDFLIRRCFSGIDKNHPLLDPDTGEPVPFTKGEDGRVSSETLSRIPWPVKREMSDELESRVMVTAADVEKPEPSSEDS